MDVIKQRERDQAATEHKKDVARRPASYKNSLSLQMPAGTTRKKERKHSPERQLVHIENQTGFKEEF